MADSGSLAGDRGRAAHQIRHDERQSEHLRQKSRAITLIRQAMPELWDPDARLDPRSLQALYTKTFARLDAEAHLSWKSQRAARHWLAAEVEKRSVRDGMDLPCPPVSAVLRREPPRIEEDLFKSGSRMLDTHAALLAALPEAPAERFETLAFLQGLLQFFAATHGGLLEEDALAYLVNHASQLEIVHDPARRLTYVELALSATGRPLANDRDGDTDRLIRRWHPDPLSLAILLRIRRLSGKSDQLSSNQTLPDCVKLLNATLAALVPGVRGHQSLRKFCEAAAVIPEVLADVPEVLLRVALGSVPSVGLPTPMWEAFLDCNPITAPNRGASLASTVQPPARRPHRRARASGAAAADYSVLYGVLSQHKKLGNEQMAAALEGIPADRLSAGGSDLREWYVHHLRTEGNAPSSVCRYHVAIGAAWPRAVAGKDPASLSESELGDVVETLLETRKSGRDYFLGRLLDFLDFCRRERDYPGLDRSFAWERRAQRVRAAFVSQRMLHAALRPLQESGAHEREIVFFILLYRLAPRPGELAGLRVADLEASDELHHRLRSNPTRDLKRTTSVRVVPCASLIPAQERARVLRYLRSILETRADKRSLVFASPMNPTEPEDVRYFGDLFSALMRDAGYLGVIMYDLRHTALSTMQLIVEQEYELAAIGGYSPEECETIRRTIVNPTATGQDDYFALARFAGHGSPDTTFTSYLHFCEPILYRRLERTGQPLPFRLVAKVADISELALTRAARRDGATDARISLSTARRLIERENISEFVRQKPSLPAAGCPPPAGAETDPPIRRILASTWREILRKCEANTPRIEICTTYGVDPDDLERKLANVRVINSLPSRKGAPRHVSSVRRRPNETRVTPPEVQDKEIRAELDPLIDRLRSRWTTHRDDIKWAVIHYLRHSTTTHPGITFHDPADLRRFVVALHAGIPYVRWRIRLRPPPEGPWERYAAKWQVVSGITIEKDRPLLRAGRYPHGIAVLSLRHPEEAARLEGLRGRPGHAAPKRYSAPTLDIALFLIAITAFGPEELDDRLKTFAGESGARS
jgi:hypothetical protein